MASMTSPPFTGLTDTQLAAIEPSLELSDLFLLTTGATGAAVTSGAPDTRIANYTALPNGPFRLTGPTLLYDTYTGDTAHRFYQMWQQSDCSMQNATEDNPTDCLNDLYPFVMTTYGGPTADHGGGTSMAFYNMQDEDAPLFKKLADEYTISDNYHQPGQGGTGIQHVFLGTGDDIYWSDGNGNPAVPPSSQIANPNPQSGTNNQYTVDGLFSNCSYVFNAPGVLPIVRYLDALPYAVQANCEVGHYYMLNNTNPSFLPNGQIDTAGIATEGRSRRAPCGRLATRSTTKASLGLITAAPTMRRSISPTARPTRRMQSARPTATSATSNPTRRPSWVTRHSEQRTSRTYSTGGHVVPSYNDHASMLKFIERNWGLAPLTGRSRDNLPNPRADRDNPYVAVNSPAIGDLFDCSTSVAAINTADRHWHRQCQLRASDASRSKQTLLERNMRTQDMRKYKLFCGAAIFAIAINSVAPIVAAASAAGESNSNDGNTTTPIKHVIVIIGENRTFDHLFATYQPVNKNETVLNLLAEGIVNADGTPGPNYSKAATQYQAQNYTTYEISPSKSGAYSTLPAPIAGGGPPPFSTIQEAI
jgi:phospholipase C